MHHGEGTVKKIRGIQVSGIGFVCSGGFEFKGNNDLILIDGKELNN